ncbi:MAG: hypothetical protein ABIH20_01535 [Candidatus Diapherotrites archaeon]
MDWEKFLEPNWNKLKYFVIIYLVGGVILALATSMAYDSILFFELARLIDHPINFIVNSLLGFNFGFNFDIISGIVMRIIIILDLVWFYIIASFIDSRLKK